MMQLIRIESTPIEYEIRSHSAKLEMKATQIPPVVGSMRLENVRLDLRSKNIQVQLDSTQMRRDLGYKSTAVAAQESAMKGLENIQELTRNYVETGQQLSSIQDGVTVQSLAKQKVLEDIPSTPVTIFLPNGGTEISWIPNDLNIDYNPPEFEAEYQTSEYEFEYTPASIEFIITQYPEVHIEYLGTPAYVPPSADPNYSGE
jgi:hypothetical protein